MLEDSFKHHRKSLNWDTVSSFKQTASESNFFVFKSVKVEIVRWLEVINFQKIRYTFVR